MINKKSKILIIIILFLLVVGLTIFFSMQNRKNPTIEKGIPISSEEARIYEEIKKRFNETISPEKPTLSSSLATSTIINQEEGKQLIAIQEKIDANKQEFIKSLTEKDYATAQKALESISLVSSNDFDFYVQKGRLAENQNNFNEAIMSYEKAIEVSRSSDSKGPAPYVFLGRIYIQQGNNTNAISIFKYGISQVPSYPDFYLMLSELYKDIDTKESKLYRDKFEELIKETKQS